MKQTVDRQPSDPATPVRIWWPSFAPPTVCRRWWLYLPIQRQRRSRSGFAVSAQGDGWREATKDHRRIRNTAVRKCWYFLMFIFENSQFFGMDMKISFQKDQTFVNEFPWKASVANIYCTQSPIGSGISSTSYNLNWLFYISCYWEISFSLSLYIYIYISLVLHTWVQQTAISTCLLFRGVVWESFSPCKMGMIPNHLESRFDICWSKSLIFLTPQNHAMDCHGFFKHRWGVQWSSKPSLVSGDGGSPSPSDLGTYSLQGSNGGGKVVVFRFQVEVHVWYSYIDERLMFMVSLNLGKYTVHGCYGIDLFNIHPTRQQRFWRKVNI